jgi:hypothetical protein
LTALPAVVTHTYDPLFGRCRNLCDLPRDEAHALLARIRATGRQRLSDNYLDRRLAVEEWLITERRRKLGATPRHRPLYFFLGDFADGRDPGRPAALVLPLAAFPPSAVTFTFPDSMASLPLATRPEHVALRRPWHGQVFTLGEIEALVARHGMPERLSATYDRFIEMQLWDDAPLGWLAASQD